MPFSFLFEAAMVYHFEESTMTEYHFNLANPHANLMRDTAGDISDSIDLIYGLSLLNERGDKHPYYRAVKTQTDSAKEYEVQVYDDRSGPGLKGFIRRLMRTGPVLVGLIHIEYQTGAVSVVKGNIKGTVNVQVLFNRGNVNRRPGVV